jgi:hypothetical protein
MKALTLDHRHYLSEGDIAFILDTLTDDSRNRAALLRLITDVEELDKILDNRALYEALNEMSLPCIKISTYLYFYILVRHSLFDAGYWSREMADYLASVLSQYVREDHPTSFGDTGLHRIYSVDYLEQIEKANRYEKFFLYAEAGNHYLCMTGIFSAHIHRWHERRGAPDVAYYEQVGIQSFLAARDHPLAREFELANIYNQLARCFHDTRCLLGEFSTRLSKAS